MAPPPLAATQRAQLQATIKLPPKTTYLDLLRSKQQTTHRTMSGGQPPLRDVSMPLSLLSNDAAAPATHAAPTRFPAKPPPPSQIPAAPAPAPARQPARAPSCRPPKAQVAHVSRIALSSASSARALARARREAETGEKAAAPELGTSARSSSGSVGRPAPAETRPPPASETSEELQPAAPPEPAAAPPCNACQAKARALRKKEAEVTSLLHELSRSDRQWRDMVALLEGQLGEARQRVLHLEAQIRRGTGISWAPPPGEEWVDEDERYMFAAGPAMAMKGSDEFLPWAPAPDDVWGDEDERFRCPAGPAGAVKGRDERLPWAPPPREVWGDQDERFRCPAGLAGAVKGQDERLPWAPPPVDVWGDQDERFRCPAGPASSVRGGDERARASMAPQALLPAPPRDGKHATIPPRTRAFPPPPGTPPSVRFPTPLGLHSHHSTPCSRLGGAHAARSNPETPTSELLEDARTMLDVTEPVRLRSARELFGPDFRV